MTRLAWMTDIHLDMAGDVFGKINSLVSTSRDADGIVITGDISNGGNIAAHLSLLEQAFEKPIYFVLGNHDYYGSGFSVVRNKVVELCRNSSYLKYMSSLPFIRFENGVHLIGHDGWYDAQNGNPQSDNMFMNDWIQISDFNVALRNAPMGRVLNKHVIIDISRRLAQQSVNHVANAIKAVAKQSQHIIIATHVPPFKESYTAFENHRGFSVMDLLPWYTSKIMGDTILSAAQTYPHIKFTVLSGHAHSHYDNDLLNNLTVKVGQAKYGNPQWASSLTI